MRVDVASQANFEAAFEKCLDLYKSIDVVVNNAGVEGEINWETQLETNFNVSIVKWSSFQFHAEMPISIKTCYIGNHPRLQIGTKIHGQEQLW